MKFTRHTQVVRSAYAYGPPAETVTTITMKTYFFKYTMPATDGLPINGTLNLRRDTPVPFEVARRKVAKRYGIPESSITIKSREVYEGTIGLHKTNLRLVESWHA